MNKLICATIIAIGSLSLPLNAQDASPACYRQMQTTFFRSDIVAQALALHNVNQGLWLFIAQDLHRLSSQIPAMIQARARALRPNPLSPFDPNRAIEILEQSLLSIFMSVMQSYKYKISSSNINNDTILRIFNYIWLQQQNGILQCLQRL